MPFWSNITDPSVFAAAIPSGGSTLTRSVLSATFTRPADTAAYTMNDAISTSTSAPTGLVFANAVKTAAGSGNLVRATLETNSSVCTAAFRLHLFNAPITAQVDNAAYTLLWTNASFRVGYIDFPALETEGAGSTSSLSLVTGTLAFTCGASDTTLYALLESKTAWTPASGQQFLLKLLVEQL